MTKQELFKKVGSMQQVAYIRPVEYQQGRSSGLRSFEVKNGPLTYSVLCDKCLDMGQLSYKGININFLSKPGLQGRNHYDTNGEEALRSIMGGFFFTSGLENICAPYSNDGKDYPMHGRIRTTPAENLSSDAYWEGDDYILRTSGEIREAELFGENMILRRSIETKYGEKSFTVTDEIENQSFRDEPLMLLYHINFGYPLMDEGTQILIPTRSVTPRDAEAQGHEDQYDVMEAPKDNEPEYVFIHEPVAGKDGKGLACIINDQLKIGVRLSYTMENLPRLMEWKSTASGDYVVGIEPANSSVYGRAYHEKENSLHKIGPFAKEKNVLTFTILDGEEEIEAARKEVADIMANAR